MKKKILIIGKNSFLASNLYFFVKRFYLTRKISYESFFKLKEDSVSSFSHILNCSIHKKYCNLRYNDKYDLDLNIAKKISKYKCKFFFFNSRKIYLQKENIKEDDKKKPKCNYSKNKLITENKLKKILKFKFISLRISNIIGKKTLIKNNRRIHHLFLDNFIDIKKKGKKIKVFNVFKDFLSIDQFNLIIRKIIKDEISGIYNISLGKKIYLNEIIEWINPHFFKKILFKKPNHKNESFTLSNKKIINKIKIKVTKNQLKTFCKRLKI